MKPKTPHKHAELIRAWADGATIQVYSGGYWTDVTPSWNDFDHYRVKPEKEYPSSSLTHTEIMEIVRSTPGSYRESYEAIANEAVKRYIQDTEE